MSVTNSPEDGRVNKHDDIVRTCCRVALQHISLNLRRDKLFKLPVPVSQQIDGPALKIDLPSIVLRDGDVTLIDGEQCPGPKTNDMVVQVLHSLEP